MLKIYHVPGTRSLRPIWLAHELGLEFEITPIDFSPAFRNSPEWRAISPAGKVPAATDDGVTMFESGAIIDYILERYGAGRLHPKPGTPQSAIYRQWCWFAEATLIRPLGINRIARAQGRESLAAEGEQKTKDGIAVVEDAVSGRIHLLGDDFSAADIMMGYSLELLASLKMLDNSQFPSAFEYLARLRNRESFKRAMAA